MKVVYQYWYGTSMVIVSRGDIAFAYADRIGKTGKSRMN